MNQVQLIGSIVSEPVVFYPTPKKEAVCFKLAVSQKGKEATIFNIKAWDRWVKVLTTDAKVGDLISIVGKLDPRVYSHKGIEVSGYEIVVSLITFIKLGDRNYNVETNEMEFKLTETYSLFD